jgi:hypothetical protein
MWKIGTHRIVAIFNGPSDFPPPVNENLNEPEFPANLDRIYQATIPRKERLKEAFPDVAFGDFEICPLEPERKGWMQAVCIESAKNIFLQEMPY